VKRVGAGAWAPAPIPDAEAATTRTIRNPWLEIPLADHEGRMGLPEVGQARVPFEGRLAGLELVAGDIQSEALAPIMRVVAPDRLAERAARVRPSEVARSAVESAGGRPFAVQTFRRSAPVPRSGEA
jgi:hypothetical protein